MFTGIIQALGSVEKIQSQAGDMALSVSTGRLDMHGVALGDSIAVNGVCLTVTELSNASFTADVSVETLGNTTLGQLAPNAKLNLEKAVRPSEALGGHIVSGHVDGVASVVKMHDDARSARFEFFVPQPLARYIARKGSVTIDGVSLTVNEVQDNQFSVNIIPHTQHNTLFHSYSAGTKVNIEVDVVARYVERLLQCGSSIEQGLSYASLADNGFAP